jgi:cellulose synthase operon protein C
MAAMRGTPAKPDSLDSSPEWPYLAASAVLTTFEAENLRPASPVNKADDAGDFSLVAAMLMRHAEPIKVGPASGRWRLRDDVRRRVLKTLGSRERMQSALFANVAAQPDDNTQRALVELISHPTPPSLSGRSLEELLGWERAVDWLEAARITPLPSRTEILGHIERHKLFEPMTRLVAGFEGREDELRALRAYVDHLPSEGLFEALGRLAGRIREAFRGRPPLVIHGPGGAGKSTLIAKFILDHAGPDHTQPMPFVLLDFDRSTLDPVRPDALLTEVANQVRTQFPELAEASALVTDMSGASLAGADLADYTKTDFDAFAIARRGLIALLNEVAARSNRNILFVIDTFEIVQRRGPTAVYSLLKFAAELLVAVRCLRVVIVGRGVLRKQDFPFADDAPEWTPMPLGGFDPVAGRAYLRARLKPYQLPPVSDAHLDRLVQQVNGNPLGLRLAAQVFAREGLAGVEEAIGRQRISAAVAEERVQGLLHARIVEHLDNEDLKKLADPGLIVRRLTPDVLSEVLAGPCGITFENTSPQLLFIALRNEVSLVEMINDTTVRHRPDVRLIMLPSQRRRLGDLARQIDDAAVRYWEKFTGPVERAEELYHRMWRGDSVDELEARWMPDAAPQLEDALDEFQVVAPEGEARIWLSEKLDRELPDEVRLQTSQRAWERDAERKARRLMDSRQWEEAQRVIHERPPAEWTDNSPLWLTDIDNWLLKKDGAAQAGQVIRTALDRLKSTDDPDLALSLLLRRVSAEERTEDRTSAYKWAVESLALARSLRNPVSIFACGVALLRLARQTNRLDDPEMVSLRPELVELSKRDAIVRALPERPALIREAAAELGADAPELLIIALERLGLGTLTIRSATRAADLTDELLKLLRIEVRPNDTIFERAGQNMSEVIAKGIRGGRIGAASLHALSAFYAAEVDRLLRQTFS